MIVVDKPPGQTSNAVLQTVKRLYYAAKAGHTGSLDPLATGVLPICFGEATKFSQCLLDADKSYEVEAKLGEQTDTGDAHGECKASMAVPPLEKAAIEQLLATFSGKIQQTPPMYSALKHQGTPLYKLARQGVEVARTPRAVSIHAIELVSYQEPLLRLRVTCSKGTYIRTLVEDIGGKIGCGAHVTQLRRTHSGPYGLDGAVSLAVLESEFEKKCFEAMNARILPAATAVSHWPTIELPDSSAYYLQRGQAVRSPIIPSHRWVSIVVEGEEKRFLGIGEVLEDGLLAPRRLLSAG